jgi:predicted dithiol-disulfide oxidoreductase (DUF899 family)
MQPNRVVSRDEWVAERKLLLAREKEHTRQRDALNAERRALPWVRMEKTYSFDTPDGPKTLAELFGGRSQLVVNHFMLGPGWGEGCIGCSFGADHIDGTLPHLQNHDVTLLAVSRAPLAEIEAYRQRMGWRFPWVSSYGSDFNHDFHVSFTPEAMARGKVTYNYELIDAPIEELHGFSVFYKDEAGTVFHTYSAYARGIEELLGTFMIMDRTPKGRNETATMDWVRRHDEYADAAMTPSCCCS